MAGIVINKSEDVTEDDKVELFTIEETGKTYYYTKKASRQRLVMKIFRLEKEGNGIAVVDYLLEQVLGKENYEELLDCDDVSDEDLTEITALVTRVVLGNEEPVEEK